MEWRSAALLTERQLGSGDNALPSVSYAVTVASAVGDDLNLIRNEATARKAVLTRLPFLSHFARPDAVNAFRSVILADAFTFAETSGFGRGHRELHGDSGDQDSGKKFSHHVEGQSVLPKEIG